MTRGGFLYGLWSLGVIGLFLVTSFYGYSPFADGGRSAIRSGIYGPTHK